MFSRCLFAGILMTVGGYVTGGELDWPQFRGPAGDGHVSQASFPLEWSEAKNLAWKVPTPGTGWAQPLIWQKRVYLLSAVAEGVEKPKKLAEGARDPRSMFSGAKDAPENVYRWELECLDLTTGSRLWTQPIAEQRPGIPTHPSNTYATETPATDGQRIYLWLAAIGKALAFDLEGKLVWEVELGVYPTSSNLGTGSSPIVVADRVFVQCYNERQSFLVALDATAGRELWRAERTNGTAWSTPFLWRNSGRTELVACGSGKVYAYEPNTGQVLWEIGGIPSSFAASPIANSEMLLLGNNGPFSTAPLFAIKPGASGDISLPKDKISPKGISQGEFVNWWRLRSGPGICSAAVVGDLLYITDSSILNCYDTKSGERLYRERLPDARDFVSSPLVVGDKLLLLDEDGHGFVVQTGREFKVLGTNKLDDVFWASPAASGDSLLLRGVDHLYCVRALPKN